MMTTQDETRQVVEAYFNAWTNHRTDEAFALLAPNLEFSGPSAEYRTAETFRPGLVGFPAVARGARIIELLVSGERAAMLYDCDLPPPVGTLRIASMSRPAWRALARRSRRRWRRTRRTSRRSGGMANSLLAT